MPRSSIIAPEAIGNFCSTEVVKALTHWRNYWKSQLQRYHDAWDDIAALHRTREDAGKNKLTLSDAVQEIHEAIQEVTGRSSKEHLAYGYLQALAEYAMRQQPHLISDFIAFDTQRAERISAIPDAKFEDVAQKIAGLGRELAITVNGGHYAIAQIRAAEQKVQIIVEEDLPDYPRHNLASFPIRLFYDMERQVQIALASVMDGEEVAEMSIPVERSVDKAGNLRGSVLSKQAHGITLANDDLAARIASRFSSVAAKFATMGAPAQAVHAA